MFSAVITFGVLPTVAVPASRAWRRRSMRSAGATKAACLPTG